MYSNCCCFFLYWGDCECLASLVGPVRVLSAVMFLMKLFDEQIQDAQLSQRDLRCSVRYSFRQT